MTCSSCKQDKATLWMPHELCSACLGAIAKMSDETNRALGRKPVVRGESEKKDQPSRGRQYR